MTNMALYLTSSLMLGLTAGIAAGPLSALLVTQTLRYGTGAGVKIALAPMITDLPIIGASLWLLSHLPDDPWPIGLISLVGGGYLLILAYYSFTANLTEQETPTRHANALRMGAMANLLNPHPYLFWMTVGTPMVLKMWPTAIWASAGWLMGFYTMLVGSKIVLALVVGKTRRWIKGRAYIWLNRIMGLLLGLLGIVLLRESLQLVGWIN